MVGSCFKKMYERELTTHLGTSKDSQRTSCAQDGIKKSKPEVSITSSAMMGKIFN